MNENVDELLNESLQMLNETSSHQSQIDPSSNTEHSEGLQQPSALNSQTEQHPVNTLTSAMTTTLNPAFCPSLPAELDNWTKAIDEWHQMIKDLGVDDKHMKFYLYTAIKNSKHRTAFESFVNPVNLDYTQYKTKILETLEKLQGDELSVLYDPDRAEPVRAYYVAVKNFPNDTEEKILERIRRHLDEPTFNVLANTAGKTLISSPQSTLLDRIMKFEVRNLRSNLESPPSNKRSKQTEAMETNELIRDLIKEIKTTKTKQPESSSVNQIQTQGSSRQSMCEWHLARKSSSYTCQPNCPMFDATVFTEPTNRGAYRIPFQYRKQQPKFQRHDDQPNRHHYQNRPYDNYRQHNDRSRSYDQNRSHRNDYQLPPNPYKGYYQAREDRPANQIDPNLERLIGNAVDNAVSKALQNSKN